MRLTEEELTALEALVVGRRGVDHDLAARLIAEVRQLRAEYAALAAWNERLRTLVPETALGMKVTVDPTLRPDEVRFVSQDALDWMAEVERHRAEMKEEGR